MCVLVSHMDRQKCIAGLVAKREGSRSLCRYRRRPTCEVNIKMGVKYDVYLIQ